jgi:hypothetical protein
VEQVAADKAKGYRNPVQADGSCCSGARPSTVVDVDTSYGRSKHESFWKSWSVNTERWRVVYARESGMRGGTGVVGQGVGVKRTDRSKRQRQRCRSAEEV